MLKYVVILIIQKFCKNTIPFGGNSNYLFFATAKGIKPNGCCCQRLQNSHWNQCDQMVRAIIEFVSFYKNKKLPNVIQKIAKVGSQFCLHIT